MMKLGTCANCGADIAMGAFHRNGCPNTGTTNVRIAAATEQPGQGGERTRTKRDRIKRLRNRVAAVNDGTIRSAMAGILDLLEDEL